jgi:hypothetical protein
MGRGREASPPRHGAYPRGVTGPHPTPQGGERIEEGRIEGTQSEPVDVLCHRGPRNRPVSRARRRLAGVPPPGGQERPGRGGVSGYGDGGACNGPAGRRRSGGVIEPGSAHRMPRRLFSFPRRTGSERIRGRVGRAGIFAVQKKNPLMIRGLNLVPRRGLEPPRPQWSLEPESSASTNSATWAGGWRDLISLTPHRRRAIYRDTICLSTVQFRLSSRRTSLRQW